MNGHEKDGTVELFGRVNHLEQNQSAMQTDITTIKDTLRQIVERLRPNWSLLVGAGSLFLMGLTPVLYSVNANINRVEGELVTLRKQLHQQQIDQAKINGYQHAQLEMLSSESK